MIRSVTLNNKVKIEIDKIELNNLMNKINMKLNCKPQNRKKDE